MMLNRYGEPFYVQKLCERESPFPPPHSFEPINVDDAQITGLFLQSNSGEKISAEAEVIRTRGRFVTSSDAPVGAQTVIRRASDNTFFRLVSDALKVPDKAFVNLKVYAAEVMEHE